MLLHMLDRYPFPVRFDTAPCALTRQKKDENAKNKPLINCIVENGEFKDGFFGNLTLCNVPDSSLREFMRTVVWPKYPGRISEALQDLMRKEVQKQK
jgi:hypothetical protein